MTKNMKFWDRIAERYAKSPVADEASYQKKLEITRDYFGPEFEVFEFGCGTGTTALWHASHVKHVHATDGSAKMIDIARAKAAAQNVDNVTFEQTTIEEYKDPDGAFDAVLGMSILHLLPDRDAAIAKAFRLLKPGGVFVTSTVCLGDWLGFFKFIAPIGHAIGVLPLVKVFTRKDLEKRIEAAGFVIDQVMHPGKKKAVFIVAKKPL